VLKLLFDSGAGKVCGCIGFLAVFPFLCRRERAPAPHFKKKEEEPEQLILAARRRHDRFLADREKREQRRKRFISAELLSLRVPVSRHRKGTEGGYPIA